MIEVTTPVPRDLWEVVHKSDPGALTDQSPEWIDAICAEGRYEDVSRLYRLADGRQAVVPLVRRRGPAGAGGRLLSPPAAWGIGGPVGTNVDADMVDLIVTDLRGLGNLQIGIRPNPLTAPLWESVVGRDVIRIPRFAHVVDLRGGIDSVRAGYSRSTRRSVKRALLNGVTVEVHRDGTQLDTHYRLFLRSVERWAAAQHEPPAMAKWRARRRDPLSKLKSMADHLGEEFFHFIAFHQGVPVVSEICLISPGRTAHSTRAAMDMDLAGPLCASHLVQDATVRYAIDAGCTQLHLGESGRSKGIARFKESFGAVGYPYSEIRLERLPISRTDQLARAGAKRVIGFKDA